MWIEIVSSDLFFIARAEGVLRPLALTLRHRGPGAATAEPPDLRIVDLAIGLEQLALEIRSAGDRPVIAFGPHVARDLMAAARDLGCCSVLSHGALAARLRPTVESLLALQ